MLSGHVFALFNKQRFSGKERALPPQPFHVALETENHRWVPVQTRVIRSGEWFAIDVDVYVAATPIKIIGFGIYIVLLEAYKNITPHAIPQKLRRGDTLTIPEFWLRFTSGNEFEIRNVSPISEKLDA